MHEPEENFPEAFNKVFCPRIAMEETELNDDDIYMIKVGKKKENNYVLNIVNNISDNNQPSDIEKLEGNYISPEDNNKLAQKQPKVQSNENNEILFLSKKTTRSITDQAKFITNKYEGNPVKKKRKKHDNKTLDNKITKIKSFIFKILMLFFNQFLEEPYKEKKYSLHQIKGELANNRTVNFNKKLMKKKIKEILSDTGDDYNENLLNNLSKNQKSYLELKLEDIFNYLRNKINDEEKIGANKIFKIIKIPKKNLDLYTLYQRELSIRIIEDQKIIEDDIKADFVKIINNRKSVNIKRIKKILKKKNK